MKTLKKILFPIFLAVFLFLAASIAYAKANEEKERVIVNLEIPSYRVEQDKDGNDQFRIDDFDLAGTPGNPLLPQKIYNIALPPNVDAESIELDVQVLESKELSGTYNIAPALPATTWVDNEQFFAWGENADFIVGGKNTLAYDKDTFFPKNHAEIVTYSQMRKWEFVKINFSPVRYNAVTGKVQVATKIRVTISYDIGLIANEVPNDDTAMDDVAEGIFYNYNNASAWYQSDIGAQDVDGKKGYAIITTTDITNNDIYTYNAFVTFIQHKRDLGYDVYLVTEDDYGSLTGQSPNGRAEKIRQWLINNYVSKDIQYVLLIGNPDPDDPSSPSDSVGNVPMKMMWPRRGETWYPNDDESPSDYFYADLTGNWDLDGDGYFGEYNGDRGTGGVDFSPEVYVGRIPVYDVSDGSLIDIFQKIISYETASPDSIEWRRSALLPMSYSDADTDGAYLAESMKDDYLSDEGFSSWTLYQQGNLCAAANSSFASNQNLYGNTTVSAKWSANDYGIVNWWGHGSQETAWIGYGDCGWQYLFDNSNAASLDDTHPAFVYQNSCTNGYPENSNNLGYSILENGGIGTVSASRVSWYRIGEWDPAIYYADNAAIGYYWHGELVANRHPAGKALFLAKSYMGTWWQGESWMNLFDFNLYGDPSTSLYSTQSNDYIQFATSVTSGNSYTANTDEFATSSATDPDLSNYQCDMPGQGAATVWYKYEPTKNSAISVNTMGSNYDTFIVVWEGEDVDNLTFVGCNANTGGTVQSAIAFQFQAGETYYIEVGQRATIE